MGAVDEDEVPLLDRLGESAREEEQGCFEEDGDTSPDPGDRGLTDSQEVGDHHLGQVLAKDQQAGHHLVQQGDTASGQIHLSRDISSPTPREYAFLRCAGLEPLKILKVTAHWAVEMGCVRGIYAFVNTSRATYFRRGRRPASV